MSVCVQLAVYDFPACMQLVLVPQYCVSYKLLLLAAGFHRCTKYKCSYLWVVELFLHYTTAFGWFCCCGNWLCHFCQGQFNSTELHPALLQP